MKAKSKEAKQESPQGTPPDPALAVSKAEAVRRAMAAGMQTPAEGVAFVKDHFGIEMDNKTFSLNRSQQRARAGKAASGKPGRKPWTAVQATTAFASRANGGDIFSDIESVKALIGKHGKAGLKRLVDAIG